MGSIQPRLASLKERFVRFQPYVTLQERWLLANCPLCAPIPVIRAL